MSDSRNSAGLHDGDWPSLDGYQIIDHVASGAMGSVYEAIQEATGRRVAVKFMHAFATSSESARRRFEREVALSARLEHPNIVAVIDSGIHRGQHYFVMEFVQGTRLDQAYLPSQSDLRETVRAMRSLCAAVDYAHQRGVLHRDLKPSNILVEPDGTIRILDFGLAKEIDPDDEATMRLTVSRPGDLVGTIAYMSPEQARGDIAQIGIRSDVYSLGAVAYELVTGKLPCPLDPSMAKTLAAIEEADPIRPGSLRAGIDADLDAILLKALDKDPARRYASAAEFGADLERYLNHQVIQARRAGIAHRIHRWSQRNPKVVRVGSVATIGLLIAISYSLYQQSALLNEEEIKKSVETWVLESYNYLNPLKRKVTEPFDQETLLDLQAKRLADDPPKHREVHAALHALVGHGYRELGQLSKAKPHLEASIAMYRKIYSKPNRDLANVLHELGAVYYWDGDFNRAYELYSEALAIKKDVFGEASAETAVTQMHLAACLDRIGGHQEEAETLFRSVVKTRGSLFGEHSEEYAEALNNLATCLRSQGRCDEAEPLFRQVLAVLRSLKGEEHHWIGPAKHNVASCMIELGEYTEAIELLRDAVEIKTRRWGPQHYTVGRSLSILARALFEREESQSRGETDYSEALEKCTQAQVIEASALPMDNVNRMETEALLDQIKVRMSTSASINENAIDSS